MRVNPLLPIQGDEKETPSKFFLLYLGRDGAGINFARELDKRMEFQKVILSSHHKGAFENEAKYVFVDTPRNFVEYFFNLIYLPTRLRRLPGFFNTGTHANLVIPMATPLDLRLIRNLKSRNVKVIQIIHDSKRHPGDLWPNRFSINKMIRRSNSLIFLSKHVAGNIKMTRKLVPPSLTVQHPYFASENQGLDEVLGFRYFLLIGRIKKYKGSKALIAAWKKLHHLEEFKNYHLVIAGRGAKLQKRKNSFRIKRLNFWLSDSYFDSLIENASAVLFPYKEASQSGVMARAILAKKFIASSNEPGLVEQLINYRKKYVGDVKDLKSFLRHAAQGAENSSNMKSSKKRTIEQIDISWIPLTKAIEELSD